MAIPKAISLINNAYFQRPGRVNPFDAHQINAEDLELMWLLKTLSFEPHMDRFP